MRHHGHRMRLPGAVHAPCMADLGHDVTGVDVDEAKIKELSAGRAPFYEPGLPELLERAVASGRLRFTDRRRGWPRGHGGEPDECTSSASGPRSARASSPPTPPTSTRRRRPAAAPAPGRPRRRQVHRSGRHGARLADTLAERAPGALLAWNPEFLREGHAVHDTQRPDRLVFGLPDDPATPPPRAPCSRRSTPTRSPTGMPVVVDRLRHGRAGQDRRERLPRHEDLLHQRDGRGVRGGRRRRRRTWRRRSATTTGSGASSSAPASASAAAACPRTSGRSWPAPASWAPTRR